MAKLVAKYIDVDFCAVEEGRKKKKKRTHLHGRYVPEELFNVIIVTAIARRILQSK